MLITYSKTTGRFGAQCELPDGTIGCFTDETVRGLLRQVNAKTREVGRHLDPGRSEERFFETWRTAVWVVGPQYFGLGPDEVLAARTVNDLRPLADFETRAAVASTGEQALLGAMLTLYNGPRGQRYLKRIGVQNLCDLAVTVDRVNRQLIAHLFATYGGW